MASKALQSFILSFTPPPVVNPVEYDGLEFKWNMFVFRPALFKTELYLVGGVLFYALWSVINARINSSRAKSWLNAYLPLYEAQFSQPSLRGLTADGSSDYFNFSTGRRNIASLHTIFALCPRHDLLQWSYQIGKTFIDLYYRPTDEVQLDFTLAPGALSSEFVWAVVAKDELLNVKNDRWDLSFTKTTENATLGPTFMVMSEFADVTDNLLKPLGNVNLLALLQDPKVRPYFRSLSITDQPRERPSAPLAQSEREKHVILNLTLPSSSSGIEATKDLVSSLFVLIDNLNKINLRPETRNKLKKIREDLDHNLKVDALKEKKEEIEQDAQDKKAAKKKAEEDRIAKLPAAEQHKIMEKERKRAIRKSQTKSVVRK
ncbi:DUF1682-domain-containing protein [Pluteus cervinus]|uniref:DUF1682-domain-containing protein n=1 Tax=Pluteus cervinus TaxID=181527 RepID=A0ACD3BDT7_9AGAR|nr:DUF1682-domain-containing protein [Pluteus cervinus]